ncbi:MAG TPA: reverse transcriptase family protein, partial [Puia sp.]|nr:reverse transcriptase family protein [Puia sp.]
MAEHIRQYLESGAIRPAASAWNSPIVLVGKKDGSTRLCCDFRVLNSVTTKDKFPLPNIDTILSEIGGKQIFSSIDLQQGFHQIKMDPNSVEKTAFSTPAGQWEWLLMPFGLCNAPATFQRLTNRLVEGLPFCAVYLDDIIVYSTSWQEHIEHLRELFGRIRSANLRMKPKKCEFACRRLLFLGHVISSNGISMQEDKMKAIQEVPFPS